MEATGVYWKPVWAMLEDDVDCLLVDARHVKNVPRAPGSASAADYFRKRDPERQTRRLISQLENLGHKVTLEGLPQAG